MPPREQVLDALAGGTDEVDAMVAAIYAAYPMELRPLAARSVLQPHLAQAAARFPVRCSQSWAATLASKSWGN